MKADMSLSFLDGLQTRLEAETQLDASAVDAASLAAIELPRKGVDRTATVTLVPPVSGPLETEGTTATKLLNVICLVTVETPGESTVADTTDVNRKDDKPDAVLTNMEVLAAHAVVAPALPLTLVVKLRSEANEKRTA